MGDNKTSQKAQDYDKNIDKTIPYYSLFAEEIAKLVKVVHAAPSAWLDTGCGTGILVSKMAQIFTSAKFTMADPAAAMLAEAKQKFTDKQIEQLQFILIGTEDMQCNEEQFDVITAILAHHYLDNETRRLATENCFKMLRQGGIYITFETIKPATQQGIQLGLAKWGKAQIENGKSKEAAEKHISRFGIELNPISIHEHLELLRQVGFTTVELFWASNMQAGFYAIK
ncbi:MAG: cmoA [Firmicutes bacterium]|nr:cmoA [Bacillota bacterium]